MSEEQREQSKRLAELADKLDSDSKEIAIAYMRGMADAARLTQRETA